MKADRPRRSRTAYACGLVIAAWLSTHLTRYEAILPDLVADDAPGALEALAVFAAIGLVFRSLATWNAAAVTFILCSLLEFSRLSAAPWIDATRDAPAGSLAVGPGFVAGNPGCYAVGVLLGILLEYLTLD